MDKLEFEHFEITPADQSLDLRQTEGESQTPEKEAIDFSSSVMVALEAKAKSHNEDNHSKVTTLQLKKVYRRGAGAPNEKGLSAMARVNMFLRMKQEGKIIYQEPKMVETVEMKELIFESKAKIQVNTFVDITENWLPIEADFIQAKKDIEQYNLNYDFKSADELYLDDYEKLDIIWG